LNRLLSAGDVLKLTRNTRVLDLARNDSCEGFAMDSAWDRTVSMSIS
jgi:hypothetical protein